MAVQPTNANYANTPPALVPMRTRYYDGVTAEALDVRVRASTIDLTISRADNSTVVARWPVTDLVVLGDTEHEAVPAVAPRGSDARLVIEDPEQRRQLAQTVPALERLARPRPSAGGRIALFGSALVIVIGLFWGGVEYGSEAVAPLVPHALQAKLGEAVRDELVDGKEMCLGNAGLAAINRLANDLGRAAGHPHKITVNVVKGGPVNAFTLPGDILVFYSDLITQAKDSSQVAGVLAHEIGHAVHYHPIKGLTRQFGVDVLLHSLTGGFSDIGTLTSGGGLLLALRNGRAFEREADATGVELLEKLGVRADGVASFFEQLMGKESTDAAKMLGMWSSHPPTAERILATKRPSTGRPAFTEREWAALRSVCGETLRDPSSTRTPKDPPTTVRPRPR